MFSRTQLPKSKSSTDSTSRGATETEKLALFGTERARQFAELKIMSSVERKMKSFYTHASQSLLRRKFSNHKATPFGTDTVTVKDCNFGYVLGKDGATRKKLAAASNCIIEYVGHVACFAGTPKERSLGKQYLSWLIQQKKKRIEMDVEERKGVTCVKVPKEAMGYVTGKGGQSLRNVEFKTSTFCFANGNAPGEDAHVSEDVLICCDFEERRKEAEQLIRELIG